MKKGKCVFCLRPTKGKLCRLHVRKYIYDSKYRLYRKKKRMSRIARVMENRMKYNRTETVLVQILKYLYGRKQVIRNVHPVWALSKKGVLLEYDIAIPEKRLLVEFDGIQHYKYPNYFHKSKTQFLAQKERDILKTKLAKKNKWKLVRFSYDEQIDILLVKQKLGGER